MLQLGVYGRTPLSRGPGPHYSNRRSSIPKHDGHRLRPLPPLKARGENEDPEVADKLDTVIFGHSLILNEAKKKQGERGPNLSEGGARTPQGEGLRPREADDEGAAVGVGIRALRHVSSEGQGVGSAMSVKNQPGRSGRVAEYRCVTEPKRRMLYGFLGTKDHPDPSGYLDFESNGRLDFVAPTLREVIALHDHWILGGGDCELHRKQLVGRPWDSCVLATVTLSEDAWIDFKEDHLPRSFWNEMKRREKEPGTPEKEAHRILGWKKK